MDPEQGAVAAAEATTAVTLMATLYDEHVDVVFGYLARRVGYELARDLTGDVFRIGLERLSTFDSARGSHRSWLLGIATNLVRHHWRTEHRRLRALARSANHRREDSDPLVDVDEQLDARTRFDRVIDAVERLTAEDRDLLILVAWQGYSSEEVGEVLAIPPGTVRSRLNRIRALLHADERAN